MSIKLKYIVLITVISLTTTSVCAQRIHSQGIQSADKLEQHFNLSLAQKDSLDLLLPAYFKSKVGFFKKQHEDKKDMQQLQHLYDSILKKVFTTKQFRRYKKIKAKHLKLMHRRLQTHSINKRIIKHQINQKE